MKSAFKLTAVSESTRPLFLEDPTRTPAVDYEDTAVTEKSDSGHGDSDQDGAASASIQSEESGG